MNLFVTDVVELVQFIVKVSYYRGHKRGKCPKCKGTGRLDWVERIFGKK